MYKLVAVDMDGTLLNDQKQITVENIEAIKKAKQNGCHVVLATGRPVEGIKNYIMQLEVCGFEDYLACFNGALVCNTSKNKTISKTFLKGHDLKKLYSLSKKLNVNIHAFNLDGCITPKMSEYSKLEGDLNHIPVNIVDFDSIDDDMDIIKMMLVDPENILNETIKKIPKSFYEEYMIVKSAPFFLEFLNSNCDKWIGILNLASYLNISPNEIICIGDAGNDYEMVKNAGLGIAMENSFEEVKTVAKFITKSNNNSGVAYAINRFVLEKI